MELFSKEEKVEQRKVRMRGESLVSEARPLGLKAPSLLPGPAGHLLPSSSGWSGLQAWGRARKRCHQDQLSNLRHGLTFICITWIIIAVSSFC